MNAPQRLVTFTPLDRQAAAKDDETLLDVARRVGAPLANSCGGVGVCARCKVRVVTGGENLSAPTSIEVRFSKGFVEGERMACQAV
ncbi:MAG TPA: 2Fe-2S iron-sulfur cluster-binding protein, partial [Thermoanaerobaculia bacterium]|nr:2Fe-2S iron-sulfur cluster-binding protein [Thermoanaerobaculia bacterium]